MKSSLQFLLQAMQVLRRKNPLTESFLVQLDLDLEGAGIPKPFMPVEKKNAVIPVNSDPVGCSSIYEIRETQSQSASINQWAESRGSQQQNRFDDAAQSSNGIDIAWDRMAPGELRNLQDLRQNVSAARSGVPGTATFVFNENNMEAGTTSGGGIELAPQPAPFVAMRNTQELNADFSAHRGAVPGAATFIFNESSGVDMDLSGDHASPATISSQSRGGSTSHSSYSPGQPAEHHLPYRGSPHFGSRQVQAQSQSQSQSQAQAQVQPQARVQPQAQPHSTSTATLAPLYPTNSDGDVPMNAYPSDALHDGAYDNSFDWELSAMGSEMESGLTPGTWNSMLESVMEGVPMGWDVLGTPHGANVDAAGGGRE